MAKIIEIPTNSDNRGNLSVVEDILGFNIKRVFYIYNVPQNTVRGGHSHKKTKMGLIALNGSIKIRVNTPSQKEIFQLDSPSKCLLLNPQDWHEMTDFEPNATLLVLASEKYNPKDYVFEKKE